MRTAALLLLVLCFILPARGQKTYLKSEGEISVNENILDNGSIMNAVVCKVKKGSIIYEYGPEELIEYRLKDGRVYCSREIELDGRKKQVFLERIAEGTTTLYFYKEDGLTTLFFEQGEGGLVEMPEYATEGSPGYREILRTITSDRPGFTNMVDIVPYNRDYLGDFIKRYENNDSSPFPYLRYGVIAGPMMVRYRANKNMFVEYFEIMDFRYQGGFEFGVFLDNPISHSHFSLHTELLYSALRYEHSEELELAELEFTASQSSITIPVLVRYAFPSQRIRPFINAGVTVATSVTNEDLLVVSAISEPAYDSNYSDFLYDHMYGFSAGGGFEIHLSKRNSLFFEVRYNNMYGLFSPVSKSLKSSEWQFLTGFSF